MFAAINKWPVLDQLNRPRIGSFIGEIDDIFSGPRSEPQYEPVMEPVLIPRTNLLACASATHRPEQPVMIRNLLRTGSSTLERDANGDTCLHATIAMSHPAQPWVVQSLSTMVKAGADPRHRNHAGYTVYDIACDGAPEFGSFRKDLLLQALLESRSNINDDRLLAPRRLTQFYTSMHHDQICGGYAGQEAAIFRKALCERLRNYVDYHRLNARSDVQEAAVDRVMASETSKWTANPDAVFQEILDYLNRMFQGKGRVVIMRRERLPIQIWESLQGYVDWPQMMDRALTAALLEFDWFRPVDPEDVFLSQVDNLIEQLEDLDISDEGRVQIEHLIEVLQNSIPSYRAVSISKSEGDASNSSARSTASDGASSSNSSPRVERAATLSLQTNVELVGVLRDGEMDRKASIAKTPAEYYPPTLKGTGRTLISVQRVKTDESNISGGSTEGGKRQKSRWGTRRKKT